jgi:glycosyltransferase involved in cell wall biosynthesis
MRILQISNKAPYPPNDGSSIAVYNMAKGFINNGVELHLLTINTLKHYKKENEIPRDFLEQSHYTAIDRDTAVTPMGALMNLFSSESFFVSRFVFKEFEEKIIEKLNANQFDIVHLEGLFVAPYIPVIRKHSNAKITIRTHNVEHLIWDRLIENEKSAVKRKYLSIQNARLKKLELQILNEADGIVTITDYDKKLFEQLGIKTKAVVSPTGIVLDRYAINRSLTNTNSVFHLASMDWMPNTEAVDWFLDKVWPKYLKTENNLQFTLAGRFMPDSYLKRNEGNLKVIGSIDDNIQFYNEHEIMMVPLQSGSGMRIKIIEGMAMGKVIVSTSIGAEGIPVTHNENIIIANTPEEFANAIKNLSSNQELKTKIGNNARKFIEDYFENTKLISELLNFYESLAKFS